MPSVVIPLLFLTLIFIGSHFLAAWVARNQRLYCREPQCRRFLEPRERLVDHDAEHHSDKWPAKGDDPGGRSFFHAAYAFERNGRARCVYTLGHLLVLIFALSLVLALGQMFIF